MAHPWKASILDLQQHVDELFEELVFRPWAIATQPERRPALDLYETPDAYLVDVDLPGMPPDEVRIIVAGQSLTIAGQRRPALPEQATCKHLARPHGAFRRSLELPLPVMAADAVVEFRHGTCRIVLPKKPLSEPSPSASSSPVAQEQYVLHVSVRQQSGERPPND